MRKTHSTDNFRQILGVVKMDIMSLLYIYSIAVGSDISGNSHIVGNFVLKYRAVFDAKLRLPHNRSKLYNQVAYKWYSYGFH